MKTKANGSVNGHGPTQTIVEWRRRLLAAQAKREELKARQEADELAEKAELLQVWSRHVTEAKNAILGVPSKFRHRCADVKPAEIEVLDLLLREALEGLADGATPE